MLLRNKGIGSAESQEALQKVSEKTQNLRHTLHLLMSCIWLSPRIIASLTRRRDWTRCGKKVFIFAMPLDKNCKCKKKRTRIPQGANRK